MLASTDDMISVPLALHRLDEARRSVLCVAGYHRSQRVCAVVARLPVLQQQGGVPGELLMLQTTRKVLHLHRSPAGRSNLLAHHHRMCTDALSTPWLHACADTPFRAV